MFVIGGVGIGKSYLINVIVNMVKRELWVFCDDNLEGIIVLLMVLIGCVVKNIKGNIIYSVLSIFVDNKKILILLFFLVNKFVIMWFIL